MEFYYSLFKYASSLAACEVLTSGGCSVSLAAGKVL